MAQPQHRQSIQVTPDYCGEELKNATEFRMACDAFLRSRGVGPRTMQEMKNNLFAKRKNRAKLVTPPVEDGHL